MWLELERDWIIVPILGMFGVFNAGLYITLFWKIDEYTFTFDHAANHKFIKDLLGLCTLLV